MSFENQLEVQFRQFSLRPAKRTPNLEHLYGDFAELMALFSNGSAVGKADLVDRFIDYDITLAEEEEVESQEVGSQRAELLDKEEAWAAQVFELLRSRSDLFQADYPFDVGDGRIELRGGLTARNKLYLMLLVASNLEHFGKVQSALTSEFERVAFETLKNFLPHHAIVRQFGKNSEYTGSAQNKIFELAGDLGVEINEREFFKILGTQERGLDVVGWIPFRDKYANFVSVFGQCACGKEWFSKSNETRRFDSSYFIFQKLNPIHAIFVPASLNKGDDFYQSDEIVSGTLVFERKRILDFVHDTAFFEELKSRRIVEKCIEYEEDLV